MPLAAPLSTALPSLSSLPALPPLPERRVQRVSLLMGGPSREREVSLTSGEACLSALRAAGYRVETLDPVGALRDWTDALCAQQPEVVFNALHGTFGEDGQVQAILEQLGLRYTHSKLLASALAMDKPLAKQIFAAQGLSIAEDRRVTLAALERDGDPLPRPFVLKPAQEGSSLGVTIVTEGENLDLTALADFPSLMAEAYIEGRELTVSVMDGVALAVTELRSRRRFYDYAAKYEEGETEHLCPAPLPAAITAQALQAATSAYIALGCRGLARADFRYDERRALEDQLVILEVNTQPGMTPLSLSPEQARARGLRFQDLCQWMVEVA